MLIGRWSNVAHEFDEAYGPGCVRCGALPGDDVRCEVVQWDWDAFACDPAGGNDPDL